MNRKTGMLLVGIGLLCSMPLFAKPLLLGDDIHYHLTRIEGIYQGLLAGEFPVRINSLQNAGFGNLSATMYPQLFLYPAAFLRLFGVPLILCYKLLLAAMNTATAFCGYLGVRGITKSHRTALAAAVLYTFSGYRLSNLYLRAALGEAMAMTFLPIVLWGVYEVLWGDRKKWYVLFLGVTGVMQSHVLSLEMILLFGVLEFLFWLFRGPAGEKLLRIGAGLSAAVATALCNAGFLVPFCYFAGQDLQCFSIPNELPDHVLYLSQMFSFFPIAEGGTAQPGTTQGEMPLSVGGVLLLGSVLFALWLAYRERKGALTVADRAGKHCLIFGGISLLLCTGIFPWEALSSLPWFSRITASLQFPWRFLSLASLFLATVSAMAVAGFGEERKAGWLYGLFGAMVIAGTGFFFDGLTHDLVQTTDEAWVEDKIVSDSNYMYREGESFQALHLRYSAENAYIKAQSEGEIRFTDYEKKGTMIRVRVDSGQENELLFPLYYFPGYRVRINGEKRECCGKETLVSCRIPKGVSEIEVRYVGPPAFAAGDAVSLITAAGLIGSAGLGRRKKKRVRAASEKETGKAG